MKRLLVVAILLAIFQADTAAAAGRGTGIGVMAGDPTGLSMKFHLSRRTAFAMGAAWSFRDDHTAFHLHGDYLWHNFSMFPAETGSLAFYYGIGGRVRFQEAGEDDIGMRIPLGLDYYFEDDPFDVFFEFVPVLDLAPESEFDVMGAIGIRYIF